MPEEERPMENSTAVYPEEVLRILTEVETTLGLEPFIHKNLLLRALQYPVSRGSEVPPFKALEFIGDTALRRALLLRYYRDSLEQGDVNARSKYTGVLGSNAALALCAQEMGLKRALIVPDWMKDGIENEVQFGKRHMLADVFEALIGAIDLDRGAEATDRFLETFFWPHEETIFYLYAGYITSQMEEKRPRVRETEACAERYGFMPIRVEKTERQVSGMYSALVVAGTGEKEITTTGEGTSVKHAINNAHKNLLQEIRRIVYAEQTKGAS